MTPLLSIINLSGGYGSSLLLKNIDFSVQPGEVVGLIGPNGCGKTTLIRHAVGVLKPASGLICLGGKNLTELSHRDRGLCSSYLPQDSLPVSDQTLGELVALGRFPYRGKTTPAEDREAVTRALKYVGLLEKRETAVLHLSGGERQRGMFARAIAQEAPLLILDEPSSSLDIGQEHLLFGMLKELARENRGILVAVHNLNAAAEYCDRIILLDRGEMIAQGSPESVLTQENLTKTFRTEIRLGRNEHTGKLLILHGNLPKKQDIGTIHLIGGAGSAVNLTRHLFRLGFRITGGVAHSGDSDAVLWETLGLDFVREDPFSPISDGAFQKAEELVSQAWLTVLCDFPLGGGNARNLEIAAEAGNLVILKGNRPVFHPTLAPRLGALLLKPGVREMEEGELVSFLETKVMAIDSRESPYYGYSRKI